MEIRDLLAALRQGWWIVATGAVLGVLVGLSVSLLATPRYTSNTQLFMSPADAATTADVFQGSQVAQQRVASYARLIDGEEVAGRIIDELDLDLSPEELTAEIETATAIDTLLIDVAVTDEFRERARDIAAAIGREFPRMVAELETPSVAGNPPVRVTVTQAPQLAEAPTSPKTLMNLALGAVLGLAAGALGAVVRSRLDRTIKDPDEAAELGGAAVVGAILWDSEVVERPVADRSTTSPVAEGYRQLRTNLQFLSVDQPPTVLMISSAMPGEGKTTVAANLAIALAAAERKVALVEADLRKPRATKYLGLIGDVGLTSVLTDRAELDDVLQMYGDVKLAVLAAGPTPPNPGELLSSAHMFSLLERLRQDYDHVIIDAPPLLPVADASGLAVATDGVLLSVRYGKTLKEQLRQAEATLTHVGVRTLGVILNMVPAKAHLASRYGFGHESGYLSGRAQEGRSRS